MEQLNNNILIAKFMGFKKNTYLWIPPLHLMKHYPKHIFEGDNTDSFRFHESWDWLMPVLEKINEDYCSPKLHMGNVNCHCEIDGNKFVAPTMIAASYKAAVEFIKYKQLVKPTNQ